MVGFEWRSTLDFRAFAEPKLDEFSQQLANRLPWARDKMETIMAIDLLFATNCY
jgi:hypothetical protein